MRGLTLMILALLALVSCGGEVEPAERPVSDLTALRSRYARLRADLERKVNADPVLAVPELELSDIVIGARTTFLAEAVADAMEVYFDRFDLDLADRVEVHKEGQASVKALFVRIGAGTWNLNICFPRLQGILHAERATIEPRGGVLEIAVPVNLVAGEGEALVTLSWDATMISGLVCGDFERQIEVQGRARPRVYDLTGRLSLESEGFDLVAQSEIDAGVLEINVEILQDSWRRLREVVRSQAAEDRCGMVLDEAKVETRLRGFLADGLRVRLPRNLNPSIRLPTQFAPVLEVFDRELSVTVTGSRPVTNADALWAPGMVAIAVGGAKTP